MGRELQKKKKRSSIAKIKMKPKSKKVNPLGNAIVAANWDQNETLTQNYRRLGLTSRLNSATGGVEKLRAGEVSKSSTTSKLAISNAIPKAFSSTIQSATVERDQETGKITKVLYAKSTPNPLNDPLNSDSDDEMADDGEDFDGFDEPPKKTNEIIRKLEEQAQMGAAPKPRTQSDREKEWIERLVAKHGEDFGKMARDMKLNPMQQTSADIGRRVKKWQGEGGVVAV